MNDFLALKVKCPICNNSLMDTTRLVDNAASIKLNVEIDGQKGSINLSSIYGSYNYNTSLEMPLDHLATFSCPHCLGQIKDESKCLSCDAPMVPFYLDMGGKVSICSRNGCKQHKVEFDDLSVALNKLYQDYGLAGNHKHKTPILVDLKDETGEEKETIESGSFLQTYCPHCNKTLIDGDKLKLKIKGQENGYLMLSPYLNNFTLESTIEVPEDKTLEDLLCFHCETSLIKKEKKCESCGSPSIRVNIGARTKLLDFYICTKVGCKWHGLNENDLFDIRLEDSLEW
jgi:hypothetical protein